MRRAAELEGQAEQSHDLTIDEAAVEAAAREAGLPAPAVRQALDELYTGTLELSGLPRTHHRRATEARMVAAAPPTVLATIEQLLDQQTFVRRRSHPHGAVFRRRFDLSARLRRLFDLRGIMQLGGVHTVVLEISPGDPRRLERLVRLEAEVSGLPSRARALMAATAVAVFTGFALTGAILFDGLPFIALAAYASGVVAWIWSGRRLRRRRNEEVREVLAGFLDAVEGPVPP